MYALQFKFLYISLLIVASLKFNDAIATGNGRRRFVPSSTKLSTDETTVKSTLSQETAASTKPESNKYRRGGAYSADAGEYIYNTADINLIHPDKKPLHTKITAKYTSSITIPHDSLEDSETAEEYVARAMGMYGSRLREPIRVPFESEPIQNQQRQQQQQQQNEQDQMQQKNQQPIEHLQQLDQQKENEEQKLKNYEYFNYNPKDMTHQSYTGDEEQSAQQDYRQYASRPTSETGGVKQQLEEQLQTQIQEQMQQAQQLVKDREQEPSQPEESEANESPAPVYEKDPVTRSYNIYEDQTEGYDPSLQLGVDRNYRTKYIYKPASQYQENANENEEKIRVSASTEIPKAEIMKQIEKSVIKYMKELEAEGKIIAAPQSQEPKTYFKVITVPGSDEKRIASTTTKPTKYLSASNGNYQDSYKQAISNQKYHKNTASKLNYQTENENTYQTSAQEVAELTPNVEFIYKIKTKAPLHTATVKTVSKPYNLPVKSYEQFDHSSALKNLEEFDISHVVTTPDSEEHPSASSNKPNKLYFNSEIYHDINSLPYKQKQRAEAEFRKLKAATENYPDYKGYAASGYYAEPPEADRDSSNSNYSEDGYPLMNPYKHVFKKEVIPSKYDDSSNSYEQQQQQQQLRNQKYKPLEFDSYNPKFNNNPEGYGYQQTYKTHVSNRHAPGKRGKRGGSNHLSANKKPSQRASIKDYEANVALRPPPKN